MSKTYEITRWFVVGVLVVIIGYDLWAYFQDDNGTISVFMWDMSQRYPIIAFVGGLISGHLFWPAQKILRLGGK